MIFSFCLKLHIQALPQISASRRAHVQHVLGLSLEPGEEENTEKESEKLAQDNRSSGARRWMQNGK